MPRNKRRKKASSEDICQLRALHVLIEYKRNKVSKGAQFTGQNEEKHIGLNKEYVLNGKEQRIHQEKPENQVFTGMSDVSFIDIEISEHQPALLEQVQDNQAVLNEEIPNDYQTTREGEQENNFHTTNICTTNEGFDQTMNKISGISKKKHKKYKKHKLQKDLSKRETVLNNKYVLSGEEQRIHQEKPENQLFTGMSDVSFIDIESSEYPPALSEQVLGNQAVLNEEIPNDDQITREREQENNFHTTNSFTTKILEKSQKKHKKYKKHKLQKDHTKHETVLNNEYVLSGEEQQKHQENPENKVFTGMSDASFIDMESSEYQPALSEQIQDNQEVFYEEIPNDDQTTREGEQENNFHTTNSFTTNEGFDQTMNKISGISKKKHKKYKKHKLQKDLSKRETVLNNKYVLSGEEQRIHQEKPENQLFTGMSDASFIDIESSEYPPALSEQVLGNQAVLNEEIPNGDQITREGEQENNFHTTNSFTTKILEKSQKKHKKYKKHKLQKDHNKRETVLNNEYVLSGEEQQKHQEKPENKVFTGMSDASFIDIESSEYQPALSEQIQDNQEVFYEEIPNDDRTKREREQENNFHTTNSFTTNESFDQTMNKISGISKKKHKKYKKQKLQMDLTKHKTLLNNEYVLNAEEQRIHQDKPENQVFTGMSDVSFIDIESSEYQPALSEQVQDNQAVLNEEIPNDDQTAREGVQENNFHTTNSFTTNEGFNQTMNKISGKYEKKHMKHKKHKKHKLQNDKEDIFSTVNNENTPEQANFSSDGFVFVISNQIWSEIKPEEKRYGGKGRTIRRMKSNWTDVLSQHVNKVHKGCVLSFRSHHVKAVRSRKSAAPFFQATATCTGGLCRLKFTFSIMEEPTANDPVEVICRTKGHLNAVHSDKEINRRNLTGMNRKSTGEKIEKSTPYNVFAENVLRADKEEMNKGNYTSVPTLEVLRKIISERVKHEQLHSNLFSELQILKESYEKQGDPYIRDIGLDPFCLIMFSDRQIELLTKNASQVPIHIDATGSVIRNIPEQKRPYMYSLVMRPDPKLPQISVADMITTEHTIPRIEFFLSTVMRSAKLKGKEVKIGHVETDFSYSLIQSALKTFNNMNIKTYMQRCYEILSRKDTAEEDLTIVHLCAAHIWKDFSRNLQKYKHNIRKELRIFIYKSFARLQNSSTLCEAKSLFSDMCKVFYSKHLNSEARESLDRLKREIADIYNDRNDDDEDEETLEDICEDSLLKAGKTIKESSPFTQVFEEIAKRCEIQNELSGDLQVNSFFCPEVAKCLLDRFMHLFPLWSGLMLKWKGENITRYTNSDVESWFKLVKTNICIGRNKRPAKFAVNLRSLVDSRITELQFPGTRNKKTKTPSRKRKAETDISVDLKEEVWSRKSKKSKIPKYQPTQSSYTKYPEVPKWGGNVQGLILSNTCTVDNGLTILYLKTLESEILNKYMSEHPSEVFRTLQTVFSLMNEHDFSAAKLVWVNFTSVPRHHIRNLHGDEVDFFFRFLDAEWKSNVTSKCNNKSCPSPYKESRELSGVIVSMTSPVKSVQQVINKWLKNTEKCWCSGDSDDANDTELRYRENGMDQLATENAV